MRVYFVEIQAPTSGRWVKGAVRYTSNRKAHAAAHHSTAQPARVLMILEASTLRLPGQEGA